VVVGISCAALQDVCQAPKQGYKQYILISIYILKTIIKQYSNKHLHIKDNHFKSIYTYILIDIPNNILHTFYIYLIDILYISYRYSVYISYDNWINIEQLRITNVYYIDLDIIRLRYIIYLYVYYVYIVIVVYLLIIFINYIY